MMRWLDETLNSTTSDWVIVNGHHTIYSCAETGPISSTYYNELLPILDRYYGILDIYLAGKSVIGQKMLIRMRQIVW